MLQFPYQEELLTGPVPPSLPAGSTSRWRPLVPVALIRPAGRRRLFSRALLDPGADDTVFPLGIAGPIGVMLRADTGHGIRWRGQGYPLRFGDVELELSDDTAVWRWPAVVGFSPAPLRYPILGVCGCLQFFDAWFRGADRQVEIALNPSYPGTVQ
jgi:hypothetical protein